MSSLLERSSDRRSGSSGSKPPTQFIQNLLKKRVITPQEAEILSQLGTPHLQFEALKAYRASPLEGLSAHVQSIKASQLSREASLLDRTGSSSDSASAIFQWIW